MKLNDTAVALTQETQYPWDGNVKLGVNPEKPAKFAVLLRIPGWVRDVPLPEKLYRFSYLAPKEKEFTVMVNGTRAAYSLEKGYARIEREWKTGDVVELNLPMPVRRVMAADWVMDDRGMVALERGPLVFCAEQADNPGGVFNLMLPDNAELRFACARTCSGAWGNHRQGHGPGPGPGQGHRGQTGKELHGHPLLCVREPEQGRDGGLAGA